MGPAIWVHVDMSIDIDRPIGDNSTNRVSSVETNEIYIGLITRLGLVTSSTPDVLLFCESWKQ